VTAIAESFPSGCHNGFRQAKTAFEQSPIRSRQTDKLH